MADVWRDNRVFAATAAHSDAEGIQRAVEELFQRVPVAKTLGPHSRVLVKPNLLSPSAPEKAVTTHPHVLRAVLVALQARGVRHITVADSPGGPYSARIMRQVYTASGLAPVCEELGAALYTACEFAEREAPNGKLVRRFNLLQPVLECDFILNLPKMKTHVMTTMSGAVKNLFGCVPGLQKAEFHMQFPEKQRFGHMLVDLCETVRPALTLVDGILAMEGDGPGGGEPRQTGLLLAGENPYTLDLALCRCMGLAPETVPTLTAAMERGLCQPAFEDALLGGPQAALPPIAGYKPPRSYEGPLDFRSGLPRVFHPAVRLARRVVAPKPKIVKANCIGCKRCADICPGRVITMREGKAHIAYKNCIRCFCCHEMCPAHAIEVQRSPLLHGRK